MAFVLATHAAFQLRTPAPISTGAAGLVEDAIVARAGSVSAKRS